MSPQPNSPAGTAEDTQTIVTNMNAGWYNHVLKAVPITNPNFQLAQGCLGLQSNDSSGLFLMSDAVPAPTAVTYYDPSGLSKRSSAYRLLLSALLPETGTDLTTVLGDMYPAWIKYRDDYYSKNPDSTKKQSELFTQFANQKLDPRQSSTAISTFEEGAACQLNKALDAMVDPQSKQTFLDSAQQSYSLYKYSASHDQAVSAINSGKRVEIDFDTSNMNTSLANTTAEGAASGFYDIFSGGASGSFDQLNTKAASSDFNITGYINKVATLSTNPIGWFTPDEYMRAYNAKNDNTIWDPNANAGDWDSFFSQPNGQLARRITSLLLVSDYQITVKSRASYSQSDYKQIQGAANFEVWPFFSSSAKANHTTDAKLNSDSTLSVVHTLNKGLIQIWGVFLADASQPT